MVRKAKNPLPKNRGYYFSQSNFQESLGVDHVVLYARSDAGFWYANGVQKPDAEIPTDLWPVRMVQM